MVSSSFSPPHGVVCGVYFQVLINEAGVDQKDKSGETKKKKATNSGEENENDASEPHLELDSRILSVLLTVRS